MRPCGRVTHLRKRAHAAGRTTAVEHACRGGLCFLRILTPEMRLLREVTVLYTSVASVTTSLSVSDFIYLNKYTFVSITLVNSSSVLWIFFPNHTLLFISVVCLFLMFFFLLCSFPPANLGVPLSSSSISTKHTIRLLT